MNSLNHGQFPQQIRFLRRQFLQDGDLPFAKVLSSASIAKVVESTGRNWRERIFSPIVNLWVFLGQVLSADNAKDVDGLMMAGRCISGDFIAHSSYRVSGNAVGMGEAAGVVAALAAASKRLPHEVPWSEGKARLKAIGQRP
jgi:hypothetical protein